ncbi:hypothetical protein LX16_2530 [Stackebrandtia albiflava]|uniref:MEMO1 family protein n=1 Tax=Stackebrandtia albiflava TaxID=406432 RepID=A0A562V1S3_9ACTN|nr:AmmeMemoRadiSam system protein B [Stackebrandtia albiflava]TWJ11795.1 hypothetical protein LX16_2530 [Stackebrandtia albiflava]
MTSVREPAVAGRFYQSGPHILRNSVEARLAEVALPESEPPARGYVVPHAGHRFSGAIAAKVYARLRRDAARIGHVVLIGPSHFVPLRGFAASPATGWRTPLGVVEVRGTDAAPAHEAPHAREHSLEVQLPFLQVCLPGVPVTPVAVGVSKPEAVADLVDAAMTADAVLLCSTDLSHYLDRPTAEARDRATANAILAGRHDLIGDRDACGRWALRGTVAWAARHGLVTTELDLRNSGDTFGGDDRVVGYSAFSFRESTV